MTLRNSLSLWVYGVLIFIGSNSLCVTHWKLDRDNSKVVPIETQHTPKHLAAGTFLDDKQTGRSDESENEVIISTLKQRYKRSTAETVESIEIDKTPAPNINKKCNVFPCNKQEDNTGNNIKIEHSLNYESRDKTLSKSDFTDDSETEDIQEQPDYVKKLITSQTKGNNE